MRTLVRLTILGLVIEAVAILSFIGIARTGIASPGKQVTVIIFSIAIIGLLVMGVWTLSFKGLILFSVFLTIGFIGIYQTLGFAFFPGLVKDIMPLSLEYAKTTGTLTLVIFIGYISSVFVILAIKKILEKTRHTSDISRSKL